MERAYVLDPLSDFMLYNFAMSLLFAGEATRAIDVVRPALARSSGNGGLHLLLGTALFVADRLPEARTTLERDRELTPANAQFRGTLVCVLAAMGDTKGARHRLGELEEQAERGTGSAVEVACGYHWLGDDEIAYSWLERAFQALGLDVSRSVANFVLVRFPPAPRDASAAFTFLQSRGILTRKVAAYGLPEWLRITIGTEDEMRAVATAVRDFMGGT